MPTDNDDPFFERLRELTTAAAKAPSTLKSRIYSALIRLQQESGPLESLAETRERTDLCVFEEIVARSPATTSVKEMNCCAICHARLIAERLESPPIFWHGCPYVQFKKS